MRPLATCLCVCVLGGKCGRGSRTHAASGNHTRADSSHREKRRHGVDARRVEETAEQGPRRPQEEAGGLDSSLLSPRTASSLLQAARQRQEAEESARALEAAKEAEARRTAEEAAGRLQGLSDAERLERRRKALAKKIRQVELLRERRDAGQLVCCCAGGWRLAVCVC